MRPLNYLVLSLILFQLAGCQKKEVPAQLTEQLDSVVAVMVFPVLSALLAKDREVGATVRRLFLLRTRYCRQKQQWTLHRLQFQSFH